MLPTEKMRQMRSLIQIQDRLPHKSDGAKDKTMNHKAKIFQAFLDEHRIACFRAEEIGDTLCTTVFRTRIEACGQNLPTAVITDDSIYTVIRVQAAAGIGAERTAAIERFCNTRNRSYKSFKYYLAETGDLYLDICLISSAEAFRADTVYTMLDVLV